MGRMEPAVPASLLHMTKVAVGCASMKALANRQRTRISDGTVSVLTRFRPKRADELVGGSLYWIVKHRLLARQRIVAFGTGADGRTVIRLDPELVPVQARPLRAHQGWRYLAGADAPPDGTSEDGLAALPGPLSARLASLALI